MPLVRSCSTSATASTLAARSRESHRRGAERLNPIPVSPVSRSMPKRGHGGRATRFVVAVAAVAAVAAVLAAIALGRGLGGAGSYQQRNLVSDVAGKAELKDADLVNGWGIALGPQTFAW